MRETLGDRLKRMRTLQNLGLRVTAGKVGISATYLSRVENNLESSPPSEEKIRALSDILHDNFDELMRLAGRVSSEVSEMIKADSKMPEFLRRARDKNYSAEELMKLLDTQDTKPK